jgi:hypothetical protein
MSDKLDKIKENLLKAKEELEKGDDELDAKIRAKLKAEMDKRNFGEADATKHVIDRDRGAKMPKPPKQPKPLLQSEGAHEVCKTDSNGQWKIEKSNYGPKGAGLYNQNDNAQRKAKNTGDVVADAGKNVNVKSYTTSAASMSAAHEAAEAKRRAANPAPVKTLKDMTPEERAALEAKYKK